METLNNIKDTCRILKLSEKTIRNMINSRALVAVKIGHSWRIENKEIRALIARKRVKNECCKGSTASINKKGNRTAGQADFNIVKVVQGREGRK